jgi:predicted Zn-ribbon and HTH transcriptional regulator
MRVLGIAELNQHLSSTAFEEVLEESFASHIRRRPDEYRFCPTPDCGFIYRSTTSAKTYTCPKCLEVTCTRCNDHHGPMTCADYKDLKSGGLEAFERFKKSMKIKDCPKCKTPIEKIDGCNHMTCGGCAAHLCWICLKIFPTGVLCYDHLSKEHGGIFNERELLGVDG